MDGTNRIDVPGFVDVHGADGPRSRIWPRKFSKFVCRIVPRHDGLQFIGVDMLQKATQETFTGDAASIDPFVGRIISIC